MLRIECLCCNKRVGMYFAHAVNTSHPAFAWYGKLRPRRWVCGTCFRKLLVQHCTAK